MVVFPNCKINIGLQVLSKRQDGYHNINTIFYPVPFCDVLEIVEDKRKKSGQVTFTSSGLVVPGNAHDNLCIKAYNLMHKKHHLPAIKMHLHKLIPMGAGLGGGSSDAAFTLRLLNELFCIGETKPSLKRFAATLGSDCAFFLENNPMLGSGKGNILKKLQIDLKGSHLVILHPKIHISTAAAYANIKLSGKAIDYSKASQIPLRNWEKVFMNDFEGFAFKSFPEILELKQNLYQAGASYASMSGSGSSVFALSEKKLNLPEKLKKLAVWEGILD